MKRSALLLVLLTASVTGCGGTSAEPVQTEMVDPPTSWLADGKTWSHQPMLGQPDEELLMKFFQLHTDFQGSSEFEGQPKMMTGENSDRRFYWIRAQGDDIVWSCVHFESGEFNISDGIGNPFPI